MDNILYIILFIIGLFVFMQVYVRLSIYLKKGKEIGQIPGTFGKMLSEEGKHLVYFYSDSCAACKPMTPIIESLRKEYKNVHKINVATQMDIGRTFGVLGTPSTVILKNRTIQSFFVGVKPLNILREQLSS